jgi:tetratricopeptide (TPR) repeat protein
MTRNAIAGAVVAVALTIGWAPTLAAQRAEPPQGRDVPPRAGAQVSPLVERYMLDELKSLRTELSATRLEMLREITDRELKVAESVSNVSNNTVTFFFYVFAGLGAAFAIWGWRSIGDLKKTAKVAAETLIARLSDEYEVRLTQFEKDLQSKGEIILQNQREIERTQTVHALWLQANQVPNPRTKIEIYDRILELTPGDPETMAYKADAALLLGDRDWALSLCNRILEDNPDSSLALYQRACARAGLGETEAAIVDLAKAIELTPALQEQARVEEEFSPLGGLTDFEALINRPVANEPIILTQGGAA